VIAMEKRIELERRGKTPKQVKELILDNTRATQVEGLNAEYTSLESLSLINVGLTSLKGFPKLPALKRLDLGDNRISSGLAVLQGSPQLTHLNLSGNRIKDLETLEPLKSLEHLGNLDLFNNPCSTDEDEFRKKVFEMLPSLKYLDSADVNNEEADESDLENNGVGGEDDDEDDEDDDDLDDEELDDEDDDDEDAGDVDEENDGGGGGGPTGGKAGATEEDGEEEEDEDDDDEEDEGPGLSAIYNDNIGDDDDGEDFNEEDEVEGEDDDVIDEEEEDLNDSGEPEGKKRKVEEDGGGGK